MSLEDYIEKIPKIDLHIHIEGTLEAKTAKKLGVKNKRPQTKLPKIINNSYNFSDFYGFKNCFYYASRCLQTTSDFELLFFEFVKHLSINNVVYSEALFSPLNFKVDIEKIKKGALSGLGKAYKEYKARINIIFDASRNLGTGYVQNGVETANELRKSGLPIIGFSIGGLEKGFPPNLFKKQFQYAKENGFFLYAHAGETASSSYIKEAIDILGVQRIGHGISLIKNTKLLNRVVDMKLPIDCCVTSNIATGVIGSIINHPFNKLLKHGALVTVNTDDPAFFSTNITKEYIKVVRTFNLGIKDVDQLVLNSIEAAFVNNEYKKELRKMFYSESLRLKKSLDISC
ncbi:MAG: adenosine deaminase [Patescibacteria group bacterium]